MVLVYCMNMAVEFVKFENFFSELCDCTISLCNWVAHDVAGVAYFQFIKLSPFEVNLSIWCRQHMHSIDMHFYTFVCSDGYLDIISTAISYCNQHIKNSEQPYCSSGGRTFKFIKTHQFQTEKG